MKLENCLEYNDMPICHRKYRDDGKLAYPKEGDKFWYTQEDIDQFLSHNHYEAYAYN